MMSRNTITASGVSLVIFIAIAALTAAGRLDYINSYIAGAVSALETPARTAVFKTISNMGAWYVYTPAALALVIAPKLRRDIGIPAAVTLAVSAALNIVLKLCFAVPRPDMYRLIDETGYGFPSGHAMNAAAFAGICALLFARRTAQKSAAIFAIAAIFILAVGFSRVYLGVHTAADVAGGYAMGLFLCFTAIITPALKYRKKRTNPIRAR